MAVSQEFLEFLEEILSPMGHVATRRMFGGAGVYLNGLMFALVADDQLYFKADEGNAPAFDAEDLDFFTYQPPGKEALQMKYRIAPETAMDDPEEMHKWAKLGFEAALRAAKKKKLKKR